MGESSPDFDLLIAASDMLLYWESKRHLLSSGLIKSVRKTPALPDFNGKVSAEVRKLISGRAKRAARDVERSWFTALCNDFNGLIKIDLKRDRFYVRTVGPTTPPLVMNIAQGSYTMHIEGDHCTVYHAPGAVKSTLEPLRRELKIQFELFRRLELNGQSTRAQEIRFPSNCEESLLADELKGPMQWLPRNLYQHGRWQWIDADGRVADTEAALATYSHRAPRRRIVARPIPSRTSEVLTPRPIQLSR